MARIAHYFLMLLLGGTLTLPPGWCCVDWTQSIRQLMIGSGKSSVAIPRCAKCCNVSKTVSPESGSKGNSRPVDDSDRCSCQDRNATRTSSSNFENSFGSLEIASVGCRHCRVTNAFPRQLPAFRHANVAIHILKCVWLI